MLLVAIAGGTPHYIANAGLQFALQSAVALLLLGFCFWGGVREGVAEEI